MEGNMVIYKIENTENKKVYIGQTVSKKPKKRWWYHRWKLSKNTHSNTHLQRAWNKYGAGVFKFTIIDEASCLTELNKLETKYIRHYRRNGAVYNMTDGGDNAILSKSSKKKLSNSLKDWYLKNPVKEWEIVISPQGEEVEIKSLTNFCKENEVRRDRMKSLFSGKISQHRGWTLKYPKKTDRKRGYTYDRKNGGNVYNIENTKTGEIFYNVTSISHFAKEHNISANALRYSLYNKDNPNRANNIEWKVSYVTQGKCS